MKTSRHAVAGMTDGEKRITCAYGATSMSHSGELERTETPTRLRGDLIQIGASFQRNTHAPTGRPAVYAEAVRAGRKHPRAYGATGARLPASMRCTETPTRLRGDPVAMPAVYADAVKHPRAYGATEKLWGVPRRISETPTRLRGDHVYGALHLRGLGNTHAPTGRPLAKRRI